MSREDFIKKQLLKYPREPSVQITLAPWVMVGKCVDIYPHAIIGETGFGLGKINNKNVLIPHVGGVKIGDYCIILPGAHIPRATAKDEYTILEENVCIDALVHVAHNSYVGKGTQIAAGTILGGSSKIGKDVSIGTNVSFKDHITIADGVFIGNGSHVTKNLDKPNWIYADKVSPSGMVYAQPIRERTEKDVL